MPNVLITGASGFVGLALTEHLLARGDHVIGYDLAPPPTAALCAFAALPGRFAAIGGDVRDSEMLGRAMRMHHVDRVVLLAAITADAGRECAMPQAIFEVNVGGVLAALNAAATARKPRVLLGSSGSVYGASGRTAALLDEVDTPPQPEGLYGISKQTAESAALRLASLHGIDLRIGRLGTCFGPWESETGVRDTLSAPYQVLQHAHSARAVRLPRDSRRDWLYVRDAAAALTALLDHASPTSPVYNLAAGFQWSMTQWCQQVAEWQPGFDWRIAQPDRDDEQANVSYYAPYDRAPMSIERLRADTGFAPRFDLPAASADFHAWLQAAHHV
ncbi:NAD-dependent epimerase/dehydratase family protein [Variovorax ginsengisoli]|uniref:UDP-glucuronate 4-epimerase n=1 Tax=Variovorax ginsengisoli TaxID=363844 RepID=A0ABT9S232_9BURK|nr:NAD(P)-dependent oxidoreductase [Variovorax ginsengisoli]MDP9897979.1 UDP-glucuronate 4-epimerase [Variovorax ginsengisoli]